ncbi:acid phosphatase 1-like protein [Tanacetum coccineum]
MKLVISTLILTMLSLALCHDHNLIIELPEKLEGQKDGLDEARLRCMSWRVAGEANNLSPWKMIPKECVESEIFDHIQFDKWVLEGVAPPINPSLKLYKEVLTLGFKTFLLTGRTENKRNATINNLIEAGFENWDRLILRGAEDHGKTAVSFKSDKRKEIVEEGFQIIGNSGDQWSDLIGSSVSMRSFKLSNPMYFIS